MTECASSSAASRSCPISSPVASPKNPLRPDPRSSPFTYIRNPFRFYLTKLHTARASSVAWDRPRRLRPALRPVHTARFSFSPALLSGRPPLPDSENSENCGSASFRVTSRSVCRALCSAPAESCPYIFGAFFARAPPHPVASNFSRRYCAGGDGDGVFFFFFFE